MNFIRTGDELINVESIARARFVAYNADLLPELTLWYIGSPEPVRYVMEPAQWLWNAIKYYGERVEKHAR